MIFLPIFLIISLLCILSFSTPNNLFVHKTACNYHPYLYKIKQTRDKTNKKPLTNKPIPRDKPYPNFRKKISESSKLSIDLKDQIVQNAFKKIVRTYPIKPGDADALVALVLPQIKDSLYDVVLPDNISKLWYEILRGKYGVPLTDYISLHPSKPICFKSSSLVVLEAFFGKGVTDAIDKLEKEHYRSGLSSPITEAELEKILIQHNLEHLKYYTQKQYRKKQALAPLL